MQPSPHPSLSSGAALSPHPSGPLPLPGPAGLAAAGYPPYPNYSRPPYPPMPAPFPPPPYGAYHPSLRPPPPFGLYPAAASGAAGSPYMAAPMSVGPSGPMMSPPPAQSPWSAAPHFGVSAASAVGPHSIQQPPPPQAPAYLLQAMHHQQQHHQHQQQQQQQQQHHQQLQQAHPHQPHLPHHQQQQQLQQQHSGLPMPQGGSTSPASLASLANLAPFLSRPHVLPAPQPIHATCLSCQQRIPMPQLSSAATTHERIACPHCHTAMLAADVVRAAEEDHFYGVLEPYAAHFDVHNAALSWLSQAKPTRTGKLAVPRAFRWPKSTAGKGGYADAFVAMGLVLRRNDTASGHWHCWYVERGSLTFQSMQAAIAKRWKESPNYKDGMLAAHDGDDGDDGDDEPASVSADGAAGGGKKRERDESSNGASSGPVSHADESDYIERDFSAAGANSLGDAVDYNAAVVDIRDKSRESAKREKRDGGTPARRTAGSKQDGSSTPRAAKSHAASDDAMTSTTVVRSMTTTIAECRADEPHSSHNHQAIVKHEAPGDLATTAVMSALPVRAAADHSSSATASPASSPISSDSSLSALSSPVSITNTLSSTALDTMPTAAPSESSALSPSTASSSSSPHAAPSTASSASASASASSSLPSSLLGSSSSLSVSAPVPFSSASPPPASPTAASTAVSASPSSVPQPVSALQA